jgi:hypothetical protein
LRLVLVDTFAAFFDGDNANDSVQGGQFMRRLRPLTQLPGKPAVLVAAHPVKNAGKDQLVPYGSGAILNEVDGNLTLWRTPETSHVMLHWQGKLRGLEFEPVPYHFMKTSCPQVTDSYDREIELPLLMPSTAEAVEDREAEDTNLDRMLLKTIRDNPTGTQRDWAKAIGKSLGALNRRLQRLKEAKLLEGLLGKWTITPKGQQAIADMA